MIRHLIHRLLGHNSLRCAEGYYCCACNKGWGRPWLT
jgi:hypothetical protein